jgi:hypothetical protein
MMLLMGVAAHQLVGWSVTRTGVCQLAPPSVDWAQ